jgi:peptide/nickel transport system permease protein
VTLVVFVLMRLVPGDIATILVYEAGTERAGAAQQAVQKMRQALGLDRSILVQYIDWLVGAVRGDFGYPTGRGARYPRSCASDFRTMLALMTMVLPVLAIPGVISAVRQILARLSGTTRHIMV